MANADRIIDLLHEARSRPAGAQRERFLAEACGDDAALQQQIVSLLEAEADEHASDFLKPLPALSPEIEAELVRLKPEEAGERIGPYKLREQIGVGGFGVVWVAEQQVPVRRTVALKIIKMGMDTKEVVARFEQERQALAMMDHPNIAKVLDVGATQFGRPFFVMELVRGIKITDYCDQANLPTAGRLALFITVCRAVQHAHQKGIIHRDLKPSNILVTLHDGVPVPKVIDFGVAKATQGRLIEQTIYTQFQQMIGTPLYMSPEQAEMSGLDVDTRTDIYTLGVLLYELLTGRTPFDAELFCKAGYDEIRRIIREEEPQKPSTALHTMAQGTLTNVAHHRASEPPKLIHAIHGDLDWIVMKSLEKDRSRRYETASGFAADIERYLADEPVSACPPSAMYRFRKFARRNRGALAIASVAGLAVLLALVGLTVSNVLITQERNRKVAALKQAKINEESADTQRGIAERNAVKAREQEQIAEANEKKAKASELLAHRRFYAAQMNLAMQAWRAGEMPRVLDLLEGQRPKPDKEDLRGFEWFYLWRLCQGGHRVPIRGHDRTALGLAFSPDGKTLASASWDRTVRLWDTATGLEQKVLRCDRGPWEVAFSPDGKTLVSSGKETGSMILWDVATGKPLHTIAGSVTGPRFTPDGKSVVGSQYNGKTHDIKEWDVASGEARATIPDGGDLVGLSTERGTLITMANQYTPSGEIRVLDWPGGNRRLTIPVNLNAAASSHDGSQISVATAKAITLRDANTGDLLLTLPTNVGAPGLAFSPDGKRIASGLENRRVVVWDIETGKPIAEDVHLDPVWGLAFSPDGRLLASSTLSGAIKLWDMTPAEEAATVTGIAQIHRGPITVRLCLRFTPDGNTLLVGHRWMTKVIDVAAGKEIAVLPASGIGSISVDGTLLAGRAGDSDFDLWDVRAGRKLPRILFPKDSDIPPGAVLSGDGRMLACYRVWRGDNTVTLWDVATQKSRVLKIAPPESNKLSVGCVEFSPDGKLLAAGFQFQWVTVWDVATGTVKLQFSQEPGMMKVISLAFSPDGKSLAVGTDGGAVTLWDLDTVKQRVAFRGHTSLVHALAFSPDGRILATAGADKTARLWDIVTGQERATLTGHTEWVTNVSFSPDGFTIATGSRDGTVKLWRGATDALALAPRQDISRAQSAAPPTLPPGAFELTGEGLREAVLRWPDEPGFHQQLARMLLSTGRKADAETVHREMLALQTKLLGGEHRDAAVSLRDLAELLRRAGALADQGEAEKNTSVTKP